MNGITYTPRPIDSSRNAQNFQQRSEGKRSTSVFNRLRRLFSPRTVQKPKQIDSNFTQPGLYSVMDSPYGFANRLSSCGGFSPSYNNHLDIEGDGISPKEFDVNTITQTDIEEYAADYEPLGEEKSTLATQTAPINTFQIRP